MRRTDIDAEPVAAPSGEIGGTTSYLDH